MCVSVRVRIIHTGWMACENQCVVFSSFFVYYWLLSLSFIPRCKSTNNNKKTTQTYICVYWQTYTLMLHCDKFCGVLCFYPQLHRWHGWGEKRPDKKKGTKKKTQIICTVRACVWIHKPIFLSLSLSLYMLLFVDVYTKSCT